MDMIERLEPTAFLGREFLTWLWFQSDTQSGLVEPADGGSAVEVWFVDRLTLSGGGQGSSRVVVRSEEPGASWEARTALRAGKKVEQACLRIVREQREWGLIITGSTLAVSSVKLPAILTREEDDQTQERFHLLDQIDELVGALFVRFMKLRFDRSNWTAEVEAMRSWVAEEDGVKPTAEAN